MRKTLLLTAVFVIAVLLLVLSRSLGSHPPVTAIPSEAAVAPKASTATKPDDISEVDRSPVERTNPGTQRADRTDNVTSSLRIHLSFAHDTKYQPRELRVQVSDLLGVQREAHRESPFEFVVTGILPGDYVVAVSEALSIATTRRAHAEKNRRESTVEIDLEWKTPLSIRWRSPDGRGIEFAFLDAPISTGDRTLTVRASAMRIDPATPRPEALQIAALQKGVRLTQGEESRHVTLFAIGAPEPALDGGSSKPRLQDDEFGHLDVPARPPFEISAWIGGVLMQTQTVNEGQGEVVFTTSLDMLAESGVNVTYCVVDDFTNEPLLGAHVSVGRSVGDPDESHPGCGSIAIEPGWALIQFDTDIQIAWDARMQQDPASTSRRRYAPMLIPVHAFAGRPLDLGTIRMTPAQTVRLRVVDAEGKPVPRAEITVVRQDSYDGTRAPDDLRRIWSDENGVVTITNLSRGKYVAMCTSSHLDSAPIVFDGTSGARDVNAIAAEIVLRPVRQISLVFDVPPRAGTLLMIETPDGLPVRTLEMDEFGIVPLWLGGSEYRVHLVEDGEPTVSAPFQVISDPFVQRIKR